MLENILLLFCFFFLLRFFYLIKTSKKLKYALFLKTKQQKKSKVKFFSNIKQGLKHSKNVKFQFYEKEKYKFLFSKLNCDHTERILIRIPEFVIRVQQRHLNGDSSENKRDIVYKEALNQYIDYIISKKNFHLLHNIVYFCFFFLISRYNSLII